MTILKKIAVLTAFFCALALSACGGKEDTETRAQDSNAAQSESRAEANEPAVEASTSGDDTMTDEAPREGTTATESPQEISQEDLLKRGRIVFLQCRACHSLSEGEAHRAGPNLHGVIGAASGGKEGFFYSDALADGKISWTEESLDKFITKPTDFASGTRMVFVGLPRKSDRDAVIAYLKEETK